MIIFHHFLNNIFQGHLKNDQVNLKKWWKMTKKKFHLKNDENHNQIVSPGKKKLIRLHMLRHKWMEAAFAVLVFAYTPTKKLELTFSNFLTISDTHVE